MKNRRVVVRRRRNGGTRLAVALLLVLLAAFVFVALPRMNTSVESLSGAGRTVGQTGKSADQPASGASEERVTEDVLLDGLALYAASFGWADTEEEARVEAARYVGRGAAGYIHKEGARYHVLGAGYSDEGEAKQVVTRLLGEEDIATATLYSLSADSVLLRVTATSEQIGLLRGADIAMREAADRLSSASFSLDRGEISLSEAAFQVAKAADTLSNAMGALEKNSEGSESPVISGLLGIMERFEFALRALAADTQQSTLSFSSRMKYNYMEARIAHIQYLRGLSGR